MPFFNKNIAEVKFLMYIDRLTKMVGPLKALWAEEFHLAEVIVFIPFILTFQLIALSRPFSV